MAKDTRPPILFTHPAHGYRESPAREMIWGIAMAQAVGAIVRNRGATKAREDIAEAGLLADAAVAEYDKRVKYETLEEEQARRDKEAGR